MTIIHNILSGGSLYYNSIWADPTANINSEKFYTATTGSGAAFSVVDLQNNIVVDSYTIDKKGGGNEFLSDEGIIDINFSTMGT